MESWLKALLIFGVAVGGAIGAAKAQEIQVPEEDPALCAEAEGRYVEMFGAPSSEAEGVTVVTMYEYRFCPARIEVPVGTTVRWVNVDKRTSHSVIVPPNPESDRVFPEEIIEFTFELVGPVDYLCGPHWERRAMIGSVTVTE